MRGLEQIIATEERIWNRGKNWGTPEIINPYFKLAEYNYPEKRKAKARFWRRVWVRKCFRVGELI